MSKVPEGLPEQGLRGSHLLRFTRVVRVFLFEFMFDPKLSVPFEKIEIDFAKRRLAIINCACIALQQDSIFYKFFFCSFAFIVGCDFFSIIFVSINSSFGSIFTVAYFLNFKRYPLYTLKVYLFLQTDSIKSCRI